jgi:hypothetical protein
VTSTQRRETTDAPPGTSSGAGHPLQLVSA